MGADSIDFVLILRMAVTRRLTTIKQLVMCITTITQLVTMINIVST